MTPWEYERHYGTTRGKIKQVDQGEAVIKVAGNGRIALSENEYHVESNPMGSVSVYGDNVKILRLVPQASDGIVIKSEDRKQALVDKSGAIIIQVGDDKFVSVKRI